MSFSLNVPATKREEFAAVVDAATASPAPGSDEQQALVQHGKDYLKGALDFLGPENTYVSGSISGHVCDEPGASYPYDSLNVAISGQPAPPEPAPDATA